MKLNRLRFCDEADQRLRHLKARTKLTPNLLCRIGFCLSLADTTFADATRYPEDSKREIGRYTLTGQYDALFLALLRERCAKDGLPTSGKAFAEQFRAHMNRGVLLLYHRVKSVVDLCKLVESSPLASHAQDAPPDLSRTRPEGDTLDASEGIRLADQQDQQAQQDQKDQQAQKDQQDQQDQQDQLLVVEPPTLDLFHQGELGSEGVVNGYDASYTNGASLPKPVVGGEAPSPSESVVSTIYMDHQATTPVDPRVLEKMWPFFSAEFGNAASKDHEFGFRASQAVEKARAQIASLINAKAEEIIFTSGATESDNIALFGVAERYAEQGNHIITCVTEHKAVLDAAEELEKQGKRVTYLPVDEYGCIDLDDLRAAITPQTILISIMAANNEIGTLAPLAEIGALARQHGIIFHTDATQAVGHIPIDVQQMNIDLLSLSAHKMYGPKGIGALYVRRSNPGIKLAPLIHGGGHERGLRSGTLNVPNIVGLGTAATIAKREMHKQATITRRWTNQLWQALQEQIGPIQLNGHPTQRLPHNLNITIPGIESRSFIVGLHELAISTGSACTTASVQPSHVITALGFGEERAHASLRFGLGRSNNEAQIQRAIEIVVRRVHQLRPLKELATG
ncbi:MAG: DNA sulfur modification protein DndE [Ardenticatenaceae bacterium]